MTAWLLTGLQLGILKVPVIASGDRLIAAEAITESGGFNLHADGSYEGTDVDSYVSGLIEGATAYIVEYTGSFTDTAAMRAAFENAFSSGTIEWR